MTIQIKNHTDFGFDVPLDRSRLSTQKWEAEIARKQDPSLLCFGTAEMDFRAAPPVLEAIGQVAEDGHFGYPFKRETYYTAITGFYQRHFGWRVERDWLMSAVGIYPAMQAVIEEFSSPGDDIVYQSPVHHIFPELIAAAGRRAVANPLRCVNGRYEMDIEGLIASITPRTRLMLLCSPHNPVGRVWSRDELIRLSEVCLARNIIVVADEVYCGLIYPGQIFTPFGSLSQAASMNSVTLMSASKSFNLTGLKHALVIAENPELRDGILRAQKRSNLYFGGCVFGHAATEAALRDGDAWSEAVVDYIRGNLDYLRRFLQKRLPMVGLTEAEATYFAWLDLRGLGLDDEALRAFLEDEAHVVLTPGENMGPGGAGFARLNLATARSTLERGLERIATAWGARARLAEKSTH